MIDQEAFYSSINKWVQADISEWTHVTLLAHFCKRYEDKHGVRFRLVKGKKGPTLGKEAADFAKLFRTFAPNNYADLPRDEKSEIRKNINIKIYNYINWCFDYKFRSGQQSVNGTRLFHVQSLIIEFERMYDGYLAKKNGETKMSKLISWCHEEAQEIFDNHQLSREDDIKMIKNYAEMYDLGTDSVEARVIEKAKEVGIL